MQKKGMVEKNTTLVSWLAAISICFQYICAIITFNKISVVLAGCIIAVCFILLWRQIMILPYQYLICIFGIIFVFFLSFLNAKDDLYTENYFLRFILFCLSAFLIGFQNYDTDKVTKCVIIIGILTMPIVIITNVGLMESGRQMGYAYACLPILIASFIGLEYEKRYKIFSFLNAGIILYKYATFAPRGIWIITISVIMLLGYWHAINSSNRRIAFLKVIVVLSILIFGTIYVIRNLGVLIIAIDHFLVSKFNLKIYALDKYMRYLAKGDVLNGRVRLWSQAWNWIKKRPIVGYGIGAFESSTGGSYCHNIFAQAFCEAGLFFVIPIFGYFISLLCKIIREPYYGRKSNFTWLIFSFCCGMEMLFFSSAYWMYVPFWFFGGAFISKTKMHRLGDV